MRTKLLVRVVRDRLGVRVRRVLVRGCGVVVGLHRMLSGGLMVAVGMVFCRFMVRFGGMLVVLCSFLVCVVCHDSLFSIRRQPYRSTTLRLFTPDWPSTIEEKLNNFRLQLDAARTSVAGLIMESNNPFMTFRNEVRATSRASDAHLWGFARLIHNL